MQKRANRILSMLLALTMVMTMLPAAVFAQSEAVSIDTWSVTLSDDIGVNFYVTNPNAANTSVSATVAGRNAAVATTQKDGSYVYTVNVAAAQMTDTIRLVITDGETEVSKECSVYEYAKNILDGNYDAEVKDMVLYMLNYGAAAQTYFGYNTGNLANKGVSGMVETVAVPDVIGDMTVTGRVAGVRCYGATLTLKSKVAVRFYFTGSSKGQTFKVGETAYEAVQVSDNMFYVEVAGVLPQNMEDVITLTVSDSLSVTYSPLHYIVRMNAKGDAALSNLLAALYTYHKEAESYEQYLEIAQLGNLKAHGNNTLWAPNANETFIYASIPANVAQDAPDYRPLTTDALKLVRGGETYSVAIPGQDTLTVGNEHSQLLIKLAAWTVSGSRLPLQAHDYLIIEGRFATANGVTLQIEKTYIYYNGSTLEFSTTEPTVPTTINAGAMSKHSANGWQSNGVYASMAENAAPYNGWSVEYTPAAVENLKLIRDGQTYNIGFPGRGTLVKYNATDYFLKMEWNVGEYAPMQDGDVLIVEGEYYHAASKTTLNIDKTYIYANGANVEFSTTAPVLPATYDLGNVMAHPDANNNWTGSGVYMSVADNAAPYDTSWALEYAPTSSSVIKRIRNGETIDVAIAGRGTLVKYSETNMYMNINSWTMGQNQPAQDGDIYIIEGSFYNAAHKATINISKTYIYLNGADAEFSTEMPSLTTIIDAGLMSKVSSGWSCDSNGNGTLCFQMAPNDAPDGVSYQPTDAACIKVIRNGETVNDARVGADVIYKANDGWYNVQFWTFVNTKPMLAGDIIVFEGDFYNPANDTILRITKTYALLNADGTVTFSDTEPVTSTVIDAGMMSEVSNKWTSNLENGNGSMYFQMAANDAPDKVGYQPTDASCIKVIRNGETVNDAMVGQDVIYKDNDSFYEVRFWTFVNTKPMLAGDIIVFEGDFYNPANDTILRITKTYALLNADGTVTFSATEPNTAVVVDGGNMTAHAEGLDTTTGAYFTLAENAIPADGGDAAYASGENVIKLVRKGQTYNMVGSVLKIDETGYFIDLSESAYLPLQDQDYLIVEGAFTNSDNGYTLNIAKTYILVDGDIAVFSTTEPTIKNVIDAGLMSKLDNYGWNENSMYFQMAANDAPDGVGYQPTDASCIKVIRNGETFNDAKVGYDVIYKANDSFYEVRVWTFTKKPMLAGDIIVFEGDFYNPANDTILRITKTYALLNADGTVTFSDTEPVLAIQGGMLKASSNNKWISTSAQSAGNLIFAMDANDAPTGYYKPAAAANVKLIRDGVTYEVGHNLRDTIAKQDNGDYIFEFWTIADHKPMKANDIIIVEGDFVQASSDTTLNITKTYILLNADGTATYSDTEPVPSIKGGMLKASSNNKWISTDASNAGNLIFTMDANDAPTGYYKPAFAANVKLIRDGVTYEVGHNLRDTIAKQDNGDYIFEFWTIADHKPMKANDIIIVEGDFVQASSDTTLNITKTYILLNADCTATYSDTEPVLAIQGGMMKEVPGYGWSSSEGNWGNVIFKMTNDAPNGDYQPTSASNIKLIRDGVTYDVARMGAGVFHKDNADFYNIPIWTIVDFRPLRANDILIVEGLFKHATDGTMLNVTKTYALLNADGTVTFSATEPVIGPESNHGLMNVTSWQQPALNPDGSTNDGGLYFTMAENDVAYTTDWNTQYKPVSAENIKLVRDGVESNVANTGVGMIIKYSATNYYLQFWPITQKPMQAGDLMIVEGKFKNDSNGSVLNIAKTYILFNENGTVSVFDSSPAIIDAGVMTAYSQGWFNNGFFFTMAANNAPAGSLNENNGGDWSVEYTPGSAAAVKLVRDGVTTEIAVVDRGTITKLTDTVYFFRIDDWATPTINNRYNLQDGDMLVVEGEFFGKSDTAAKGYTLNISKSYITFDSVEAGTITFSTGADTEFGEVLLPSSNKTMKIGVWNGSHHVFTDARLAELQAAGITKIMGIVPEYTGEEYGGITGMLDRAHAHDIEVIVDLRSWDGETVPEYANHPALLGFLMFDEPCATDFDALANMKAKFDAVMPAGKLFYVNLYGSSAAGTALMGTVDWALGRRDYDQYYVQRFLDKVGVEVLSWDSYCLLEGEGIRTGYFKNFEVIASKTGVEKWYTMLSSGHNTTATYYTTPTAEELRWQMAVAMTYGISNIDHYIYTSHASDYSTMLDYSTETVTDLYYDIKDVDNEYLAWDNIYMSYEWLGVGYKDVGTSNAMFADLKKAVNLADYGLSVESTEDMLVGVFQNNGNKAYMVTNAGTPGNGTVGDGVSYTNSDATVTLTLDAADYKCAAVISQGEITYVAVENNTVTIDVDAYEGVFVIPVLN